MREQKGRRLNEERRKGGKKEREVERNIKIICIIKTFVEEHLFGVKQLCPLLLSVLLPSLFLPASHSLAIIMLHFHRPSLSAAFIVKLLFPFFFSLCIPLYLSRAQTRTHKDSPPSSFPSHSEKHTHRVHWFNSLSLCTVLS